MTKAMIWYSKSIPILMFWSREFEIDHSVGFFWKRNPGSSDELDVGEAHVPAALIASNVRETKLGSSGKLVFTSVL